MSQVIADALATGADPAVSDAYTINGQPGNLNPCSKPTMFTAKVEHGKTYLLRLINAAVNNELFFAVAGHLLTVVGKDASYTKPFATDFIMIAPGQTVDALLAANATAPGRYYMAARPYSGAVGVAFNGNTTTGVLDYGGSDESSPPVLPSLPEHNDTGAATQFAARLRSLASEEHPVSVPESVDERLVVAVAVNLLACEPGKTCGGPRGDRLSASLNNVSFVTPSIDVLEAYYRNISGVFGTEFPPEPPVEYDFTGESGNGSLLFPKRAVEVKVVEHGARMEVVFQGTNLLAAENHPMHLHGYSFYVVGRGFGNFDEERDPVRYNLVDPPYENTVGVPKNGWAAVRFTADNPGMLTVTNLMRCSF